MTHLVGYQLTPCSGDFPVQLASKPGIGGGYQCTITVGRDCTLWCMYLFLECVTNSIISTNPLQQDTFISYVMGWRLNTRFVVIAALIGRKNWVFSCFSSHLNFFHRFLDQKKEYMYMDNWTMDHSLSFTREY